MDDPGHGLAAVLEAVLASAGNCFGPVLHRSAHRYRFAADAGLTIGELFQFAHPRSGLLFAVYCLLR